MSLDIFDNIIKQMQTIKKKQDADCNKEFAGLNDDDITKINSHSQGDSCV